jgi:hypothetical protein
MNTIPERNLVVNVSDVVDVVYLASPKPTFESRYYTRMVGCARTHFPHSRLLEARGMFRDNQDWLERWPEVLASLSALVFFAEVDGTVGMGVSKEVSDALAARLPVYYLTGCGGLLGSGAFELVPHAERSPRRFARVALREP